MYSQYSSSEQPLADELAIQNMLKAIKTMPFTDEEVELICSAIKAHILNNAMRVNAKFDVSSTKSK